MTWLVLAACAGLYFGPPLFALMWAAPSWGTAVAVAVFAGCLLLFWVFAVYGLTNACWALLTKVQGKECRVQGPDPNGARLVHKTLRLNNLCIYFAKSWW